MYWCEAWCCQEMGRYFLGSLPFSVDTTLCSVLRFVSRLPHVRIGSRSKLVLHYLSGSWWHRVVICVLEASFGRKSLQIPCPAQMSWQSSGYFEFPVNKVARNTLASSGRFISSLVSWEGLGGHDISFSSQHMAFQSSRATRWMSSINDAWPLHCGYCNHATSLY